VALERMKLNAEDLVAQAQEFQPRPLTRDRSTGEEGTLLEVNAFRTAVEPLIQLATRFRQLGATDVYNKILRILTLQALNTLQTLDTRLSEEDPYAAKSRNFGWWNGQGALSLAAFEARNPTELAEYLTAQRERVKFIEQQVEPFVRFLEIWFPTRGEGQSRLIAKWQRIIADFRQYDGKRPGASVTALEEFITAEMDKITPENACKSAAVARGREQDLDFFLQIRNNLRNSVVDRCEELGASAVFDAYNEIADQFNRTLAGKFPFSNTGPADRIENEASPDAVLDFYKLLDRSGKAARGTLQQNARFSGGGAQAAIAFLDQMDNLRAFVAPQSAEGEKEPPFTVDFMPKFRFNQAAEIAGNQIIEWTMQVGGQIWRLGEPDHPGRWRPGNPVRLSLRFAKDSLDFPVLQTGHPNIRVRGERNAFFEYTNRWALLAFLRRHEAPPSELARSGDLKPYTLKLRLKTDRDPRWQADDSPRGEAVVYMNMRLMPPGGKTSVVVPPFPVRAPGLERPSNQ
jgi:type VI secretion system protein ImpL